MFWDQKVSQKGKRVFGLDLNQILTLNVWFNNLCSVIIYFRTGLYESIILINLDSPHTIPE